MPVANILQPLIDIFEPILVFFHDSLGFGWGFSIVFLTVVVRAAILPLAVKQYRSMRRLQEVAPHMKAIQEKYKNDKQRQQQELMRFYQENKINPAASCLPLLLQLPVFLALFYLLQGDLRERICGQRDDPCGPGGASEFLFIPDLTDKATGGVLVALIVLYVVSQMGSSLLMMTATADRNQRMIMLGLPFVFIAFIWNFPAGLLVYWITTNLWTVVQQVVIRRIVGPPAVPAGAKTEDGGGGFLEMLRSGGRRPPVATATAEPGDGSVAAKPRARQPAGGPPPASPRRRKKKRSGRRR